MRPAVPTQRASPALYRVLALWRDCVVCKTKTRKRACVHACLRARAPRQTRKEDVTARAKNTQQKAGADDVVCRSASRVRRRCVCDGVTVVGVGIGGVSSSSLSPSLGRMQARRGDSTSGSNMNCVRILVECRCGGKKCVAVSPSHLRSTRTCTFTAPRIVIRYSNNTTSTNELTTMRK